MVFQAFAPVHLLSCLTSHRPNIEKIPFESNHCRYTTFTPNFHEPNFFASQYSNQYTRHPARTIILSLNASTSLLQNLSSTSSTTSQLFQRHFVASLNNLYRRRWHSLVLSGLTHANMNHLLANGLGLYTILGSSTFDKNLGPTLALYATASGLGSLAQVVYSRSKVVGASAALMALLTVHGLVDLPRYYVLMFPIPGLTVSNRNLVDILLAVNLGCFTFNYLFKRGHGRIAWLGHLVGMGVGYIATFYQWEDPPTRWPSQKNKHRLLFRT